MRAPPRAGTFRFQSGFRRKSGRSRFHDLALYPLDQAVCRLRNFLKGFFGLGQLVAGFGESVRLAFEFVEFVADFVRGHEDGAQFAGRALALPLDLRIHRLGHPADTLMFLGRGQQLEALAVNREGDRCGRGLAG